MSAPPIRSSQTMWYCSRRPNAVAVAPRARKITLNPSTNITACENAVQRRPSTSSRDMPVMNVT